MGAILNFVNARKINTSIKFLKHYRNSEKIQILKLVNEDFLMDKELFCSFFSTTEYYFNFFDTDGTGLIDLWEVFFMIFLFKADPFNKKFHNMLKCFSLSSIDSLEEEQNSIKDNYQSRKNTYVTIDEINFISETFLNVLVKLFEDKLTDNEKTIIVLRESVDECISEIFHMEQNVFDEIKLVKLIK